jgi:hypothetical protein
VDEHAVFQGFPFLELFEAQALGAAFIGGFGVHGAKPNQKTSTRYVSQCP